MTPNQAFQRAKSYYAQTTKSLDEARARTDEAKKRLDELLNRPEVRNESECSELLSIAQSATQFRIQKEQEATAAEQDAQAASQLEDSAWNYYWNQCPE